MNDKFGVTFIVLLVLAAGFIGMMLDMRVRMSGTFSTIFCVLAMGLIIIDEIRHAGKEKPSKEDGKKADDEKTE